MKSSDTIHLAAITDAQYSVITAVMLTSVKKSKLPTTRYCVHLFQTKSGTALGEHVLQLDSPDFTIDQVEVDITHLEAIKAQTHTSVSALLKFELSNLLPGLDKVLYIDGDCIATQDLSELYATELGDNLIAACPDGTDDEKTRLLMGDDVYINSGVLLMNLALMRKEGLAARLLETKQNLPPICKLMDQDAFNAACKGRIHYLPVKYNYLIVVFRFWRSLGNLNRIFGTAYPDYRQLDQESVIIHYGGDCKPWLHLGVPGEDLWMQYYFSSPYGKMPLARDLERIGRRSLHGLMKQTAMQLYSEMKASEKKQVPEEVVRGYIRLFGLLPLFSYKSGPNDFRLRLFFFIPLLKIMRTERRIRIYLFECLLVLTHRRRAR